MDIVSIYSTEGFQAFFQHSPLSLVIEASAKDFKILAVSDSFLQLVNMQRSHVLGKGFFDIFPRSQGNGAEKFAIYDSFCRVIATRKRDIVPVLKYDILDAETDEEKSCYCSHIIDPVLKAAGEVAYLINTITEVKPQLQQGALPLDVLQGVESLQEVQILNVELAATNEELIRVQEEMSLLNLELEQRVAQRTKSLSESEARYRHVAEKQAALNVKLATVNHRLAESEQVLQMAIQSSNMGTWQADLQTGLLMSSEKSQEIHGLSNGVVLHVKQLVEMIDQAYQKAVIDCVKKAIANHHPFITEYLMYPKGKTTAKWIRVSGVVRLDERNHPVSLLGTIFDITEQKQDETRKNDFIGMVSHELKTPLTSIKGYIQILQAPSQKRSTAFTVNLLDKTNQQIAKMIRMINGFLNVSRLESGKIQIDYQRFNLAELIREAEEETLTTINSHKVLFSAMDETWVNADKDKLGQVINNLISNAVKYSPVGSIIEVACNTRNGNAEVSVKDHGMGVAQEDIPKLFDRYYRVKGQVNNIGGFGIGLYLCCEIIKRLEGNLWVESEIGKGSTFYFTVPLA